MADLNKETAPTVFPIEVAEIKFLSMLAVKYLGILIDRKMRKTADKTAAVRLVMCLRFPADS